MKLILPKQKAIESSDFGDIEGMSRDVVIVKRGYIHKHYYTIPVLKTEGRDGQALWLKIKEDDVKGEYERQVKPNPSQYLKTYLVFRQVFQSLNLYLQNTKDPIGRLQVFSCTGLRKGNMAVLYVRGYLITKMSSVIT